MATELAARRSDANVVTQSRWYPMQGPSAKNGSVKALPPQVFALLGASFVFTVFHVYTTPGTGTQPSSKTHVVPKPGSLTVPPVTVGTVVYVTNGDSFHKGAVLEKTGLGVFYEPCMGLK